MKKITKILSIFMLVGVLTLALTSCNKKITFAERFNDAGVAMPKDNLYTEISYDAVSATIDGQKDGEVIVLVYGSSANSEKDTVLDIEQDAVQYNDYAKQKYNKDITFKLYFVESKDMTSEQKKSFRGDAKLTNSAATDAKIAIFTYVNKELDYNSTLQENSSTTPQKAAALIFTFQVGDKLKALVA